MGGGSKADAGMAWNDLIGTELGQYTIIEELGRGGSSRVYRAHDANLGRDVAIKVIQNDSDDRVGFVRRFQRELQAVAQLDHPNIVPVYDQGETQDFVYLVMQCVNGGTFRQQLGAPLPVREAAMAAWQMARASSVSTSTPTSSAIRRFSRLGGFARAGLRVAPDERTWRSTMVTRPTER